MDSYYNPQSEADLILVVENTGTVEKIAKILKTMPGFEDIKVLIISLSGIIIKSVGVDGKDEKIDKLSCPFFIPFGILPSHFELFQRAGLKFADKTVLQRMDSHDIERALKITKNPRYFDFFKEPEN